MIFAPHKFDTRLAEHNRSMHRIIILQSKTKYIYAHGVILDYSPHTFPSGRATIVRPNPLQRCQFYHSFEHPTLTNCVKVSSAIQKICIVLQFWGYEVREGHLGDVKNSHFASVRSPKGCDIPEVYTEFNHVRTRFDMLESEARLLEINKDKNFVGAPSSFLFNVKNMHGTIFIVPCQGLGGINPWPLKWLSSAFDLREQTFSVVRNLHWKLKPLNPLSPWAGKNIFVPTRLTETFCSRNGLTQSYLPIAPHLAC